MSEYKLMEEEGSLPTRRRYDELKRRIRQTESDLFKMKAELLKSRRVSGKTLMAMPNKYNCATCHNGGCINHVKVEDAHPNLRYGLVIIQNQTTLNGCLEWSEGL